MDQIGPIGKDMADVAALLNIISGKDPADQTSAATEPIDLATVEAFSLKGFRIGVPEEFLNAKMDSEVKNAFLVALEIFRSAGAGVETFPFPELNYAVPAYAAISCAEASTNVSRLDGIKYGYRSPKATTLSEVYEMSRSEGFGADAKKRIMLGNLFLSLGHYEEYYLKALKIKAMIAAGFQAAFKRFDAIVGPVSPSVAPITGEYGLLTLFESEFFTVPASLAGLPSASVPYAKDSRDLSMGLQIIGLHFSEAKIIGAGAAFIRADAGRANGGARE
jgi:aspartyl-tRNA(Asn)/glutamyl-tRNA(Gln) amidotransferase subunit A